VSKVEFWKEPEDSIVFDSTETFDNMDISSLKQPCYSGPTKSCLVIRKGASQTQNMAEFQDPAGNVMSYIDCNGVFHGTIVNDDALGKPTSEYYNQLYFLNQRLGLSIDDAILLGQEGRDTFVRRCLNEESFAHGYPQDDAISLMQGDPYGSNGNLDIFYAHQFVQNEKTVVHPGGSNESWFILEHTPILEGSLTGTIYRNDTPIQTFVVNTDGTSSLAIVKTKKSAIKVDRVELNTATGELGLFWNDNAPGPNHAIISYEYNMECQ
jgi:hypothetical protein